jgi:DNA-binding SARP family transcriptional activator
MRFRILGPLQLIGDDGPVEVGRPMVRSLLAVLLLRSNQAVSSGCLAAILRDGDGGLSGSALRTHVMLLRRALGRAERLHTTTAGYLLEVRPGELDIDEFRGLAERGGESLRAGHHAKAAELLQQAVTLWREPPLVDLPLTETMNLEADQLLHERCIASDLLVEARMALGQHSQLLDELRRSADADPVNEQAWARLMLALYRSRRQAEAFDRYARLRTTLSEEYGTDPGPDLQHLYQQILCHDPALDLTARQPAARPLRLLCPVRPRTARRQPCRVTRGRGPGLARGAS